MANKLLMGNEAFAHAALEAGVGVVAGYPGTPSSELVETVAKLHAAGVANGIHVEWSTNEKSALELLEGASIAGARCLFTCKQVGLNVASDPLMSLNYIGVNGGLVLFVADDPGPISSQTEQDTRRFGAFAKIPVLDPATPEQGFAMMKAAFDLSERYGTPVIVRPTTRINHASTFFNVAECTEAAPLRGGGFEKDSRWVIFPRRAWEAHGEVNERLMSIAGEASDGALACFNPMSESVSRETASLRLGIVAGGVSAAYAQEALEMLAEAADRAGIEMPAFCFWQVGVPYPFPDAAAARFADGLDHVIVFEELDYVLEDAMLNVVGKTHAPTCIHGKLDGFASTRGENSTEIILHQIASFFDTFAEGSFEGGFTALAASLVGGTALDMSLPVRPPVLCAGCPHRGSFYAVKRALGKRPAVLCGDIGCYTLGNAQPLDAVDTCLCMGAGITMAQGFAAVEAERKQVAFVGDSTFFASGLPGIVNAVYNQHDVTVAVLDNATTAMTGSQPHPGTGVTLMGPVSKPISIEAVLRAVGFECIVHADPLDLDESVRAAEKAIDFSGPSAILFESPCIQLKRPETPVSVDPSACTGCKKCITEIGCPGIGFDSALLGPKSKERGQAVVDVNLCNGCGLCTQVCPFGAIGMQFKEGARTDDPSAEAATTSRAEGGLL